MITPDSFAEQKIQVETSKLCEIIDRKLLENNFINKEFRFEFRPSTSPTVIEKICRIYEILGWNSKLDKIYLVLNNPRSFDAENIKDYKENFIETYNPNNSKNSINASLKSSSLCRKILSPHPIKGNIIYLRHEHGLPELSPAKYIYNSYYTIESNIDSSSPSDIFNAINEIEDKSKEYILISENDKFGQLVDKICSSNSNNIHTYSQTLPFAINHNISKLEGKGYIVDKMFMNSRALNYMRQIGNDYIDFDFGIETRKNINEVLGHMFGVGIYMNNNLHKEKSIYFSGLKNIGKFANQRGVIETNFEFTDFRVCDSKLIVDLQIECSVGIHEDMTDSFRRLDIDSDQ